MSALSFQPRVILIAAAFTLSGFISARAQVSDADYSKSFAKALQGDTLFVTTHTEGEIGGRLVRLTPETITVTSEQGERIIALRDVGWIEKRGDPLWNGALMGGAIWGFGMMAGAGASCSPNCRSEVPAALALGFVTGAGVGALIDRLIPGRRFVYGKRLDEPRDISHGTRSSLASLWTRVTPGDRITVSTASGGEISGRFARASESSLTVVNGNRLHQISANEVTAVRRYRGGTHVKKGLFIGVPLGALSGVGPCYRIEKPDPVHSDSGISCGAGVLLGAAGGGAVGALIGGKTWGSTVVYNVAPVASPHSVGVIGSFSF